MLVGTIIISALIGSSKSSTICYNCNSTTMAGSATSACPEPFNATATTPTCNGTMCMIQWGQYYNSPQAPYKTMVRSCSQPSSPAINVSTCTNSTYGQKYNTTFFQSGNMCCWMTMSPASSSSNSSSTYNTTTCLCANNSCNGAMMQPMMMMSTTTMTMTNAADGVQLATTILSTALLMACRMMMMMN